MTQTKPINRRLFLQSSIAALLTSQICLTGCDAIADVYRTAKSLSHIDASNKGRLGLSVRNREKSFDVLLRDHQLILGHRKTAQERFGMCSTFKLPLAAMILRAIDQGEVKADTHIPIRKSDILSYTPINIIITSDPKMKPC